MGKRSSFDFEEDDDGHEALLRAGKALLSPPKGKDQLLRLLKGAGESLAEASQSSENAKHAARDLAKALGRSEFLRHKDKEVRLYTALCLCHILRLNAPDTPYSDAELQSIFELLSSTYGELEDPASPHFQLCLSILETVSQVKCCLLILDLPNAEELVCGLFNTLLDVVNEENVAVLEGTVVELLRSMIEEGDDLPQQQLDILLSRLLPAYAAESPAGHAAAAALLQRTETTVQPYLQKFLTALLLGSRTDSELKDDYHSLFYAIHETVPQALLPLMPLLKEELEVDGSKRGAAVDLVARLFTQHPSGGAIIEEYEALFDALLKRACDKEAGVRRKVLEYARPLMLACSASSVRQLEVLKAVVGRLFDVDDRVRQAATAAVAALLTERPALASSTHTEGRGTVLSCLLARLRDKKPGVRREAAAQLAALTRSWVLAAAEDPASAPSTQIILGIPLVLCNLAVRDAELGAHVFDSVFHAGIFPAKLAPADVAHYWAVMWQQAGEEGRPMLAKILQGKASMQHQVQALLQLRAASKEQRTSSLAGAASSMDGGGGSGGAASGSVLGGQPSGTSTAAGAAGRVVDPVRQLQARMQALAAVLQDVSKPEEGLQRLMDQKDNHIFKGLASLATFGCTYKEAVSVGKDVMQRVGSKGPAADLVRALVARLTPSLLPPEVLHAAMEEAEQSQEAQHLLVEVAGASPQLLAQSLDHVLEMFEADDPLLSECAAKVLARAGRPMLAHYQQTKQEVPRSLIDRLSAMCTEGSPSGAKAAVKALVVTLGQERAAGAAVELADKLMDLIKSPATLSSHRALLAALKALSQLGRLLPEVFERTADELTDFVLNDLMEADLTRGKPLREANPARTGRVWRRPSPSTEIKAAALRTLCQALVPDSTRAKITQAMSERARLVWEALEPLVETDPHADQFQPFAFLFPRSGDASQGEQQQQQQRAKRRRVEGSSASGGGGSSGSEEEQEEDEDEELACTDAAWVRYSAVCGLLRLARAHDGAMPASLYANLAMAFQEPLPEPRHAMTAKLAKAVALLTGRLQAGQKAAKYAAILALFAIDPEDRNRAFALRTLRDFVLQRRRAVAAVAQSAAASGAGGTLIQEMPEFMLTFLVFLLAHHPEYPTEEVLEEYSQASQEEREEMYGGGTPFSPFLAMLQFALEPLAVPVEHPTNPAEVARLLPAALKLLRTLKFCDDASAEPRTQEAHQLCDLSMLLLRQIAGRLTKGKPQEPGRFPGQVVLPRLCFKPNMQQGKKADGSDLPESRYFSPGLYEDDLFMRRLVMGTLPGPAAKGSKPRSKPRAPKAKAAAAAAAAAAAEDEDVAQEDSEGGSLQPDSDASDAEEQQEEQEPGSSGLRKRKALAAGGGGAGGKRSKPSGGGGGGSGGRRRAQDGAAAAEEEQEDSEAESGGGTAEEQQQVLLAPRTKKAAAGARKRAAASGRTKPAGTPSRQQPRRGAKTEAAGKTLAESSEGEEEGGEGEESSQEEAAPGQHRRQQQQRAGKPAAVSPAAAAAAAAADDEQDPMYQSDFENASLGSPEATPGKLGRGVGGGASAGAGRGAKALPAAAGGRGKAAAPAGAPSLRAGTDDEEDSQQQSQQQLQQQQQRLESPGQENRAASNGGAAAAAAARRRGGSCKSKAAAAAEPAFQPAAKSKAGGGAIAKPAAAKAAPKRSRA